MMKTSKLKKLAWAFFALALTATSVSAQGFGNTNRVITLSEILPCIIQIDGLTEKQVSEIQSLEQAHQETIATLRNERRSTIILEEKNSIREKMVENKVDHRNAVKALLNPDQQRQFDLIQAKGGMGKYRSNLSGAGYGTQGKGFRQGKGSRNNCCIATNKNGRRSGNFGNSCRGFRNNRKG